MDYKELFKQAKENSIDNFNTYANLGCICGTGSAMIANTNTLYFTLGNGYQIEDFVVEEDEE